MHSNLKDIINIFCVLSIRIVFIQMCVRACELFMNAGKEKVWVSFIILPFLLRWHPSIPEPGAQYFLSFVGSWQTAQPPYLCPFRARDTRYLQDAQLVMWVLGCKHWSLGFESRRSKLHPPHHHHTLCIPGWPQSLQFKMTVN